MPGALTRRTVYARGMTEPSDAPDTPGPCTACHGTGVVLSGLGGELAQQPCPWCDGGGVRLRDYDAQARWRATAGDA